VDRNVDIVGIGVVIVPFGVCGFLIATIPAIHNNYYYYYYYYY